MYFASNREGVISEDSDIIQRSNSVLNAAGIKASIISQNQLIVSAPVMFVKAFEGIYGDFLRGINYSPRSRDDHVSNMNILVSSLQSRYHFEALSLVTGQLIVDGDHLSVAIIIDIFYGHVVSSGKFDNAQLDQTRPFYETKHREIIPGELRTIINRVSYLRNKLDTLEIKQGKEQGDLEKTGKKRKMRKSKSSKPSGTHDRSPSIRRHSGSGDLNRGSFDEDHQHHIPADSHSEVKSFPLRKGNERPTSAAVCGRKTSDKDTERTALFMGRVAFGRCVREDPKKSNDKDIGDCDRQAAEPMYTYDTTSGRKVHVGELEALQRRRQKSLESGVIGKSTLAAQPILTVPEQRAVERKKQHDSLRAPVESTSAQFPGYRTEQSVEEFNNKMKSFREPKEVDPFAYLSSAVALDVYQTLQPLDILVSVEQCHNCEYHDTTLRHKSSEYISQAEDILHHLIGVLHASQPCARVGAVRIPAEITPKSKTTDYRSRIGALEIQIAYLGRQGSVKVELLHSKLKTRRWPGKSVVEKRMHAFLSKMGIQTYNAASTSVAYPGLELCSLEDHTIAWIFDAKGIVQNHSTIVVDTDVRVSGAPNKWSGIEKYSREGRVASIYRDNASGREMAKILFKYFREAVEIPASNCSPLSDPDPCPAPIPQEICSADGDDKSRRLPDCLRVVLANASDSDLVQWQSMSPGDVSIPNTAGGMDFFLCRSSFYHQIHRLAWKCIADHPGGDGVMMQPFSNGPKEVDVQLAYSECVLDWVFNKFGKVVNMSALVHLARSESAVKEDSPDIESNTLPPAPSTANTAAIGIIAGVTTAQLTEVEKEDQLKVQKMEARKSILLSITDVMGNVSGHSTGSDKERSAIALTKSSSGEIIVSLRTRIRQVCLALSAIEGNYPGQGSHERDSIGSNMYHCGAKKLFDAFDEDSSGELNMKQFNDALVKFGIDVSDNELLKLWASLDIDGNSHISLPELLSFLNFEMKVGYRELGEIWEAIRKASGAPPLGFDSEGNDDSSNSVLENMEKDMFSLCTSAKNVGNVVSAETFFQILRKFDIYSILKAEDARLLVVYFGEYSVTQNPVSCSFLNDEKVEFDLTGIVIKFDDFFSWLQPVDFVKVCRRISRFLKALSQHENGLGDSDSTTVLLAGTHTIPPAGESDDTVAVSIVQHKSLAMDKPTYIRITPHGNVEGKYEFTASRDSDVGFSIDITRVDSTLGWVKPLELRWEIVLTEENVAGIPVSAIDPEKTGRIHKDRFASYVDNMGLTVTPAELRSLYRNFGSDDGVSMSYDNLNQLINCSHVTHKFVPVIGSRVYRKKSIADATAVGSYDFSAASVTASVSPLGQVSPPTLQAGVDSLELRIGLIELDGEVLDSPELSSVMVEVKYLLQDLRVIVDNSSRQGAGKRFIDELDWDPIMLTASALKMNADICVAFRSTTRKNKVLGKAFFSPNSLIEKAGEQSHVEKLSIKLANDNIVKITLHMRVRVGCSRRLLHAVNTSRSGADVAVSESVADTFRAVVREGCKYEITHVDVKSLSTATAIAMTVIAEREELAPAFPSPEDSTLYVNSCEHVCSACTITSTAPTESRAEHVLEFTLEGLSYDELLNCEMQLSYGIGDNLRLPVDIRNSDIERRPSIQSDSSALEEAEKLILADEGLDDMDLYPEDYDVSGDIEDDVANSTFLEQFED